MGKSVFISYRRDDSAAWVDRVYERLSQSLRNSKLFMDVDDIPPGRDFVRELERQVAGCDVLLCMIGRGWLDARDGKGRRRLDDENDFVRIEVASALRRDDIRVVPVLIDGARMPEERELPASLKPLARRNAVAISRASFGPDIARLVDAIEERQRPAARAAAAPTPHRSFLSYSLVLLAAVTPLFFLGQRLELGGTVHMMMLGACAVLAVALLANGFAGGYRGTWRSLLAAAGIGWLALFAGYLTHEAWRLRIYEAKRAAQTGPFRLITDIPSYDAIPLAGGLMTFLVAAFLLLRISARRR
ncbi:MAG: toll/interleukin-1 receptor domain-containing protein [Hyphomicrobiaceae bacterium]